MAFERTEQLQFDFESGYRKEKQTRIRYTKAEVKLLKAAAEWCVDTGVPYHDVADVLAVILPHTSTSIRTKLSKISPRRLANRRLANRQNKVSPRRLANRQNNGAKAR